MKPLPFRLKIALLSTAISGVVLAGFGTAAYAMIARQKTANLDKEIRSLAMRHRGWLANRQALQRIDDNLGFIFGGDPLEDIILLIADPSGKVLYVSPDWPENINPGTLDTRLLDHGKPAQADKPDDSGGFHGGRGWGGAGRGMGPGNGQASFTKSPKFLNHGPWRLGIMGTEDITLVVGWNTRQSIAELAQLRNGFLIVLPIALAIVGIGGWIVAGRALRPIRAVADTAEQVTARGLDQRIPWSDEDPEITRLIEVFNRMMDRLEAGFQQATRFSADASHELRTPLAIMQGELENALQDASPGSKEQLVLGNLLEETQRLKTITAGLLLLARADSGELKPEFQILNFASMLDPILEDARAISEELEIQWETHISADVFVRADPGLLRTAILNLFVNSVKYNQPKGRIEVSLSTENDHAILSLGNSGPGIPEQDRELIFNRFHRADTSRNRRVDGVGLGLNLSREILRVHGGDVGLKESRPGWTCFEMKLRLAAAPVIAEPTQGPPR